MAGTSVTAVGERFHDFEQDPVTLARRLLGQRLVRIDEDGRRAAGLIVEVEAYLGDEDRAAHTFGGRRTERNETMYAEAGHLYVYFTYGMHHCMNVVAGAVDEGVAVLIRAIEPVEGTEVMAARRGRGTDLCSGPARLTQALAIDRRHDGADLRTDPSIFVERTRRRAIPASGITVGPRIGVDYAGSCSSRPLRFHIRGNPYVSGRRKSSSSSGVSL